MYTHTLSSASNVSGSGWNGNTRNIDESRIDVDSLKVSNFRYFQPDLRLLSNGIFKILYLHSGLVFASKSDTYHCKLVEKECNLTFKFSIVYCTLH